MTTQYSEYVNKFNIGDEVVCPLMIDGKLVKDYGYNIPTIGIIESIVGNHVTVKDKYLVFNKNYCIRIDQIEQINIQVNGDNFYKKMIENSKKFNKSSKYRFSYGPAAANLYFTEDDISYTVTFDYAYNSLYFSGISNILDIDLNNIKYNLIKELNEKQTIIFKNMVREMISKTENFTFSNIPSLIDKLKPLI